MHENLRFEDGKYSAYLPWKELHKLLPDNLENSVARLRSQLKRVKRNSEILKAYDSIDTGSVTEWYN